MVLLLEMPIKHSVALNISTVVVFILLLLLNIMLVLITRTIYIPIGLHIFLNTFDEISSLRVVGVAEFS